jgi:hypothetical protein
MQPGAVLFLHYVLSRQLCGQGLRVAQALAGSLAAVQSSVRERLEHLLYSSRHAETAHLALECPRSLLGDAQSCPEEPLAAR